LAVMADGRLLNIKSVRDFEINESLTIKILILY
jgi:hypothetical protein